MLGVQAWPCWCLVKVPAEADRQPARQNLHHHRRLAGAGPVTGSRSKRPACNHIGLPVVLVFQARDRIVDRQRFQQPDPGPAVRVLQDDWLTALGSDTGKLAQQVPWNHLSGLPPWFGRARLNAYLRISALAPADTCQASTGLQRGKVAMVPSHTAPAASKTMTP